MDQSPSEVREMQTLSTFLRIFLSPFLQNCVILLLNRGSSSFNPLGTTWLQEVIWQIFNDGEISRHPIGHRVQFFDEAKFPHTTQPDITTTASPRLMKTHQPFHAIPKGTSENSRCKYIYVARNPFNVVVSYYNFDLKMAPVTDYDGPFEYFADMFIKGTSKA